MNKYDIGEIVHIPDYNIKKAKIIDIKEYDKGDRGIVYDYSVRVLEYFDKDVGRQAEEHTYAEEWVMAMNEW
jgi:hypothetical protein